MKSLFLVAGLSAGLLCGLHPRPVQAESDEIKDSIKLWQKPVELRLQEATSDDVLVQLGRAADVNIVADVTEPPADDPPITVSGKTNIRQAVTAIVTTQRRIAMSFDKRTMLFWPAPNFTELVKMIRDEQENAPKPAVAPLSPEGAPKRWEEYLRQSHKWDGNWQGVDIKVALDDLPADLRSQVQQEVDRRLGQIREDDFYQRRASDELWANARLYVGSSNSRSKVPHPPSMILRDTRTPLPNRFETFTRSNIVLGPLPKQVRR